MAHCEKETIRAALQFALSLQNNVLEKQDNLSSVGDTQKPCERRAENGSGAQETWAAGIPDGYVLVPKNIISFLNGTGELEGCAFGERPENEKGNFWWRKYLRSAPQVKAETVDLPKKREMRNPVEQGGKSNDWYQNGYDVGYNCAIDDISQNYNITRKTK